MFEHRQRLHFMGIGGIGMSGLAEIMLAEGCAVSGCDLRLSAGTERLAALGAAVTEGHDPAHLAAADALVVTSAVPAAHPEPAAARARGLPVVRRGELLAGLMRTRTGVAVGGSHGKTTASSMIAAAAVRGGLDPTVVIGGRLAELGGSNARHGRGPHLIAESDESDGSFLELSPVVAVITNVDREHLDYYRGLDEIRAAFTRFANKPPYDGLTILCLDDANTRGLRGEIRRRTLGYGTAEDADLRLTGLAADAAGARFKLRHGGRDLGEFRLGVLGRHNALNAAAAVAAALAIGVDLETVRAALAEFRGAARRMEWKGREAGVSVFDDYGHHPAEVRATLEAARLARPARLVVLFQPHRYTRTKELMEEFAAAFAAADVVRVTDLYAASETPIAGVDAAALARRIAAAGHPDAQWSGSLEASVAALAAQSRPGDLVVTLGAGSVTQAGPALLARLRGN